MFYFDRRLEAMQKLKHYWKEFIEDESGMELLQLAVGVVVSVGLIWAILKIQRAISDGLVESAEKTEQGFDDAFNASSGTGGSGSTTP